MSGGRDNKTRVIVFTTEGNLRLLQSNREWLGFAFVQKMMLSKPFYFYEPQLQLNLNQFLNI